MIFSIFIFILFNIFSNVQCCKMKALGHYVCRNGFYPRSKIARFHVPDDKVLWNIPFPEYNPIDYTSETLIGKPYADPSLGNKSFIPKWYSIDGGVDRRTFECTYTITDDGFPLNPRGRTGIKGRGLLGRWGPNHAGDPIVSRWKRDENDQIVKDPITKKPVLQVIIIKRGDNGQWAFPGGMVDPGENVSRTAVREFLEEATNFLKANEDQKRNLETSLKIFFSKGELITETYVDDPRNTDNAWMETVAYNYHDDNGTIVNNIPFEGGDDAVGVRWIDVDKSLHLYASHKDFLEELVNIKNCHW